MPEFAILRITSEGHEVESWHDTASEAITYAARLNVPDAHGVIYRAVGGTTFGTFKSLTGESLYLPDSPPTFIGSMRND